jgi:hypothetical protein
LLICQNEKGQWVGEPSASSWLFRTPDGLRKTLVWLDSRYSVDGRKVGGCSGLQGLGATDLNPQP